MQAIGDIPTLQIRQPTAAAGTDPLKSTRTLWFRGTGEAEAAILDRARLPAGFARAGPCVIESLESTILVPPGWRVTVDEAGFVLLTRADREETRQ